MQPVEKPLLGFKIEKEKPDTHNVLKTSRAFCTAIVQIFYSILDQFNSRINSPTHNLKVTGNVALMCRLINFKNREK